MSVSRRRGPKIGGFPEARLRFFAMMTPREVRMTLRQAKMATKTVSKPNKKTYAKHKLNDNDYYDEMNMQMRAKANNEPGNKHDH